MKPKRKGKHNKRWALYVADVASGMSQAACARKRKVSPQAVWKAIDAAKKAKVT